MKPLVKFWLGMAIMGAIYLIAFAAVAWFRPPRMVVVPFAIVLYLSSIFAIPVWSRVCNSRAKMRRSAPLKPIQFRLWAALVFVGLVAWTMASGPFLFATPKIVSHRWSTTPTYATQIGPDPARPGNILWRVERPMPNPRMLLPLAVLYGFVLWQIGGQLRQRARALRDGESAEEASREA